MTPEQIAQIEKIVEEVLQAQANTLDHIEKQMLVVIGATQSPLQQIFQNLQTCMQDGWKIRIILSELATKVINLNLIYSTFQKEDVLIDSEIDDIPALVESHSLIVLPAPAYPMVGKLALRLADTPATYLVYHALICGKSVIAVSDEFTTKNYSHKKTVRLDKIDPAHVNKLSDFGVQWVTVDQMVETIYDVSLAHRVSVTTPIISASVIAKLAADVKELVYYKSTIITPLAYEHAQKRGIKLIPKS